MLSCIPSPASLPLLSDSGGDHVLNSETSWSADFLLDPINRAMARDWETGRLGGRGLYFPGFCSIELFWVGSIPSPNATTPFCWSFLYNCPIYVWSSLHSFAPSRHGLVTAPCYCYSLLMSLIVSPLAHSF